MTDIGELHSITTFDGTVYHFNDGSLRFVVSTPGNMGLPEIEYHTRRTYKSDGLVETGYRAEPRLFNLDIYLKNDCDRSTYWSIRDGLLDVLRPNRGGPVTYTILREDGVSRSITVRSLSPGFAPTSSDQWQEWTIAESLQFQAFDPAWFDTTEQSVSIISTAATELTFPLTIDASHIVFDAPGVIGNTVINYIGTWYSYPTIIVTGPFTTFKADHVNLGISITVLKLLATGTLTMDLENKTFLASDGIDYGGYLSADSDLQGWRLEPVPIVGVNTLAFTLSGATPGVSAVSLTYKNRYIGI